MARAKYVNLSRFLEDLVAEVREEIRKKPDATLEVEVKGADEELPADVRDMLR